MEEERKEEERKEEERKEEERKEEVETSELPFQISDEYKDLILDFDSIVKSGKESFQETAEGRKIEYVGMYFAGRYGVIVEVDQKGIPKIELTRLDVDNTGQKKVQKFLLGLRAEASTKAKSNKTTEFSGSDSNAKNFEVNSSGYELVKRVIGDAQKEGERKQKKIEEEEIKYFAPIKVEGITETIDLEKELDINLNEVTDLVVMARQVVKEKLGSKLDSVNVSFFKFGDSVIFVSSEGHKINQVVPRTGFTILVKTKEGSQTYGCIRGVGGMEVLKKESPGKSTKEIVCELTETVVKQAFDMDKAQNSGILGSECPVILSGHVSGVLGHEGFGHVSEADIILENKEKKTAEVNLKSRIGGQVSENTKLTVVDIASLQYKLGNEEFRNSFGAISVDDMGTKAQDCVLIEDGVQVNILNSRYTFAEMIDGLSEDIKGRIVKEKLSGNLRSENFSYPPIIRMRNTCIMPDESSGLDSVEQMAAKVPKNKTGVYIHTSEGGWVDPDSGVFEIHGALCYLIQNSTIIWSKPIRNVRLNGNITKIGGKIKYIGTSKTIKGSFTGYCGKDGQRVPVEAVGPAIYLEDATIGSIAKPTYFRDLYGDWRQQIKERKRGVRDKESIYLKQVEEVSTKVGIRRKKDHSSVCMVSGFLDVKEEKNYITGEGLVSDFSSSVDGKLVKNKGIMD